MIQDPHQFLPFACRVAAQVVRCRLLAEEAGERAIHQLTLSLLQGEPPAHPKAWLRSVARRSACAILRSEWGKTRAVDGVAIQEHQAPYRIPRQRELDGVREALDQDLTARQRAALRAVATCNSTSAAARSCGMQPRDFRRSLFSISRKARAMLAGKPPRTEAYADDAAVVFQLDT